MKARWQSWERNFSWKCVLPNMMQWLDPAFIASAKMAVNYYVKCVEAKSEQAPLESYLARPPDTTVVPSTKVINHARDIFSQK